MRISQSSCSQRICTSLIIRPGDAGQIVVGPEFASLKPYQLLYCK